MHLIELICLQVARSQQQQQLLQSMMQQQAAQLQQHQQLQSSKGVLHPLQQQVCNIVLIFVCYLMRVLVLNRKFLMS